MEFLPPQLLSLNISYTHVSDEGMKRLPSSLKQLHCIYCEKITSGFHLQSMGNPIRRTKESS